MAASASEIQVESMMAKVALECGGDISASQEEILANASFLGADDALHDDDEGEEEEVFATPPEATQQQQQQEEEDPVTMCTLPFTPTPSKSPAPPCADASPPPSCQVQSPAPPSSADAEDHEPLINRIRKPRICIRKVRGARIRTPTPSPDPQPQPPHVDPLLRAVLMIPTRTTTTAAAPTSNGAQDAVKDFIALARQKGIF